MTVDVAYVLHGINTTANFYSQLTGTSPRSNIEDLIVIPSGHFEPLFVGQHDEKPEIQFGTHQVQSLLGEAGILGTGFSAANVDLYYKKLDALGDRVADATAEHIRMRAANSFLYVTDLSAGHHKIATAQARLLIIHDGSANPALQPAGSTALAGTPTAAENFVLGPVAINGTVVNGVDDFKLQLSPETIELGCASQLFATFGAMKLIRPVIELVSYKTDIWTSHHKLAITDLRVNLLKKEQDGDTYGTTETEHISIVATTGHAIVTQTEANDSEPAKTTMRIPVRAPDSVTRSLTISTGVAVTTAAP